MTYLLVQHFFDGEDQSDDLIAAYDDFERPALLCIRLNRKDIRGKTLRARVYKSHKFYYGSGYPDYWYTVEAVPWRG